ncbi:MAG TPA: hypothetical protein VHD38_03615 [Candidatus Paceibacterota bacterium]|nr:hypothetical protein [Candidatus Paceibacterota bacterium]
MTKNPYLNAGVAIGYIALVVLFINSISHPNTPDTWFTPVMVLSLFTFSAAFMAYTFFFEPVQMYLDGQKREAIDLFKKTLVTFGIITAIVLAIGATLA